MTKTSDRLSYLRSQLQGNFHELITHFPNLRICKFIEPCLNTPELNGESIYAKVDRNGPPSANQLQHFSVAEPRHGHAFSPCR